MLSDLLFSKYVDKGERIKYVAHTHYLGMAKPMLKNFLFGFLLPALIYVLFPNLIFLCILFFTFFALKTIYNYFDWFFDAWVVTNLGVIDIEWNGIFNRSSSKIEYNAVEGVTVSVPGFWATLFNFGNIYLETPSQTKIDLPMCMNPSQVESKILRYRESYLHERSLSDESMLRDILSAMVARHVEKYGTEQKT